jgi:hypothetical protein
MPSQDKDYLNHPTLDLALVQFRQEHGGGWVTKIPYADGYIFIHLKEADWETYRRAFRVLKEPMRSLGDMPEMPTNVAMSGFLARVTFGNRTNERFARDWSGRDRAFDIMALFGQDLERPWLPRFSPDKLMVKKVDEEMMRLLWPSFEVAPWKDVERLLLFKPDKRFDRDGMVHGSHLVALFFTIPFIFDKGSTTQMPIPFFNPDRQVPNAQLELEVSTDESGEFIFPAMQTIKSRMGVWMTEGHFAFNGPSKKGLGTMVTAIRTMPGAPGEMPAGSTLKLLSYPSGYRMPKKVTITNPRPPIGGAEPMEADGWVEYSFREEEAQQRAWEETPLKKKMEVAAKLIVSSDPDERSEGLGYVGKYANEGYLDMVLPSFNDPDPYVVKSARKAYSGLVGMSYEQHQAVLAAEVAERERIVAIARKEGRVTNILIKDSVLQRTNIGIVDGGEHNVKIEDSVVTKSNLDGKTEVKSSVVTRTTMDGDTEVTDSVVVRHQTKDGEKVVEDVRVGPGPKEGEAEEAYEVRLAKYEKALKRALADGTITEQEKKLLEALRKKFGISQDEHEMMLEMMR